MSDVITRPRTFSINHRGQRWSGDYSVDADGMLRVGSAYGSGARKLGRYDPLAMAERMLKEQVDVRTLELHALGEGADAVF